MFAKKYLNEEHSSIEIELYNEIKDKLGCRKRLSVERIVSGPGLASIYEFLARKAPEKVDPKVHEEFLKTNTQQGNVVGENAKIERTVHQTLEIFVGTYGREAGNAMIKYLPRGGFYITESGLFTKKDIFLDFLFDKGRVSPALRACPICLVLTEELGEHGAHFYALQLLQSGA
ncbi:hypothetical protein PsorP6_015539 [Peronosclerospora sorghi]|uniref:Uncharacterized protein n=1 Tax=Peronosclerospora sorghi TaxID=230839 RepID=A0ACC0WMR4_9STRA|nr:hypothetical protein PsorP6_015539 [Peronosclerospora sorghi]